MDVNKAIKDVMTTLLQNTDLRNATKFLTAKSVVRISRRHKFSKRNKREEFVITIGEPNYEAKIFINQCIKAKEPFPIKRIQLKYWPKKK